MFTSNEIAAELDRIAEANGGILIPEDVVESARNPKSILHGEFDWDNNKAAEQWRLQQARQLIRLSVITIGDVKTRRFFSLKVHRQSEDHGYRSTLVILADEELKHQLVSDALADMNRFQTKYAAIQELVTVFEAMQKAQVKLKAKTKRKELQPV